jgi:hypothetical protein
MKGHTRTGAGTQSFEQRRTGRLACVVGLALLVAVCGRDTPLRRIR